MSYALVGPYSFDLKTVVASGRHALSAVGAAIREGRGDDLIDPGSPGNDPGLYVMLRHDGVGSKPSIFGMWVVIDGEYMDSGPAGPPDRVPPFAKELLDAATEEVWWHSLDVFLGADSVWRPVIVLEYPSHMSSRSALAPPGVPFDEEEADESNLEERETWLEAVDPDQMPPQTDIPYRVFEKEVDRFPDLPGHRSLVVVVRGTLDHDGRLHTGSFFMVPPSIYEDGTSRALTLDDWLDATTDLIEADAEPITPEEEQRHHLGRPLQLFGDRIGFHSSGWLTRNLGVWPARPSDITIGLLTDRVVQQKWISQGYTALVSSAFVVLSVGLFVLAVRMLTAPVPELIEPPPPPAAQPAMSVCSADYQEFVDEFRCQITRLAGRSDDGPTSPICRDPNSADAYINHGEDLQAAFCGLLDRELDGWTANLGRGDRANFAEFAASQACFNVLGHPYPYRLREYGGGRVLGNPTYFLDDDELGIQPLVDLVAELDDACESYRSRSESMVEGAIFATHVGSRLQDGVTKESGGSALRRAMLFQAMVGVTTDASTCFRRGMDSGTDSLQFERMCVDEADRLDRRIAKSKMWRKLGGSAPETGDEITLIDRYAGSRYRAPDTKRPSLWQCHLALESPEEVVLGRRVGKWDITVPVPARYDINGAGAQTQLTLDATLRALDEGTVDAGICWDVVSKRLSNYRPVHPLLADLEGDGWPSEEQQLCGQVCAARFNVRRSLSDSMWVTRDSDLGQCIQTLPGAENDFGVGKLDRLRMPWNYSRRGEWTEPDRAQICGFNLVAQNLLPTDEDGYIVGGRAPKEFAGETAAGSRIVGGETGLAARYVKGLAFARIDSVTSLAACGNVAAQCFTAMMLEVTGDPEVERYRWLDTWRRRIENLTTLKRSELASNHPWCVGIKDYLLPERETAQFDTPCVAGVAEARANTEGAIRTLASDVTLEGGN